jgi:hypothetical protein
MLSRSRFRHAPVCPKLGDAVEVGSCQASSSGDGLAIGETLGARLGPGRRRSGGPYSHSYSSTSLGPACKPWSGRRAGRHNVLVTILRSDLSRWLLAGCSTALFSFICLALGQPQLQCKTLQIHFRETSGVSPI